MRIAVTSTGDTLDAPVDPRFGRARRLLFVDRDTLECEAVPNPHADGAGGAGVQTAQMVVDHRANAVVTGNIGPNAYQVLTAAGVEVYVGATGTVRQALQAWLRGELARAGGPSVGPHFGVR